MNVLYYAHHHGSGHLKNALYFHKSLQKKLWIASSREIKNKPNGLQHIALSPEDESRQDVIKGREMLPHYLHYSPMGNQDILERSHQIISACLENEISLAIIDLSVEVASLLRAASVPFAYVRLPGNRTDTPHLECFRAALFLLAYYPKELEDDQTPQWVVDKTVYLGFLQRHALTKVPELNNLEKKLLNNHADYYLVVKGFGGHSLIDQNVKKLRKKLSGYYVSVGPLDSDYSANYDLIIPYSQNVEYLMKKSARIIIPPSLNLTSEALSAHKPITVIPDDRHFDEHLIMAKNLIQSQYADGVDDLKTEFKTFEPKEDAEEFITKIKGAADIKAFYQYIKNKIE